jgi:hypothetical protein
LVQPRPLDDEQPFDVAMSAITQANQPFDPLIRRRCDIETHDRQYRIGPRSLSSMELVVLGTYNTLTEANLVKARLESEGIEAVVQSDDVGSMTPTLITVRGVQVLVRSEDRADAMESLERMLGSGDEA